MSIENNCEIYGKIPVMSMEDTTGFKPETNQDQLPVQSTEGDSDVQKYNRPETPMYDPLTAPDMRPAGNAEGAIGALGITATAAAKKLEENPESTRRGLFRDAALGLGAMVAGAFAPSGERVEAAGQPYTETKFPGFPNQPTEFTLYSVPEGSTNGIPLLEGVKLTPAMVRAQDGSIPDFSDYYDTNPAVPAVISNEPGVFPIVNRGASVSTAHGFCGEGREILVIGHNTPSKEKAKDGKPVIDGTMSKLGQAKVGDIAIVKTAEVLPDGNHRMYKYKVIEANVGDQALTNDQAWDRLKTLGEQKEGRKERMILEGCTGAEIRVKGVLVNRTHKNWVVLELVEE